MTKCRSWQPCAKCGVWCMSATNTSILAYCGEFMKISTGRWMHLILWNPHINVRGSNSPKLGKCYSDLIRQLIESNRIHLITSWHIELVVKLVLSVPSDKLRFNVNKAGFGSRFLSRTCTENTRLPEYFSDSVFLSHND